MLSPVRAPAFAAVLLLIAPLGCAARNQAGPRGKAAAPTHRVSGRVSFEADHYRLTSGKDPPRNSLVPSGHSQVRLLRVCLVEQRGTRDLQRWNRLEDDKIVGCTATDANGDYEIALSMNECPRRGDCWARYYLATDLCVWSDERPQVCIAADTDMGKPIAGPNWSRDLPWRKWMWSSTYTISLRDRTSTILSWNLSCSDDDGEGRKEIRCDKRTRPGRMGRGNSNMGFTVEAIHANQAAAAVVARFGSLAPNRENTGRSDFCGGPGDRNKKHAICQDAIRVIIRRMKQLDMPSRVCGRNPRKKPHDASPNARQVCVLNPQNPYVVAHEIGHVLHRRWLGVERNIIDREAEAPGWRKGTAQKNNVTEGWADFVAAATFHDPGDQAAIFDGAGMEPKMTCSGSAQLGEGGPAKFFWDLYDAANGNEPSDQVSVSAADILAVWAKFPGDGERSTQDRTVGECDPHGRNIYDYLYHWTKAGLPSAEALLAPNCVDGSVATVQCG